jgi:hypothetical protein
MRAHAESNDETLEHFRARGWMRVPGAFSASDAAAMRDAVWRALARTGIRREDCSTWPEEAPSHLQALKTDPVFGAVGAKPTLDAIEATLEGQAWNKPKNWGACFITFPSRRAWCVPASGWHADANYTSALAPPAGVRVHALFGDVSPRCGGTQILSGSHRLVHKWLKENPPSEPARGADHRESLRRHPYIRDLNTPGDVKERVARFMDRAEEVDGAALQVVENTGLAGDVLLLHPLVLHVAAPNSGAEPRFLLSGGVDTAAMWAPG